MNIRILSVFLLIILFAASADSATNGFLSFEYAQILLKDAEKGGTFQGVQIGLVFSDQISPAIGYSAELHWRENRLEAREAWLKFFSSEYFRLQMGLYLVPFGIYNSSRRPYETLLVNPPLNIQYAFPAYWRDIGAAVEGRAGRFGYVVYFGNGLAEAASLNEGQQFLDNNANKSLGGRIRWLFSQTFEAGYSYCRGKVDVAAERQADFHAVDISWKEQYFQIQAEYTRGGMENPEGYSRGKIEGYYVQASMTLRSFNPVICFQDLKYCDPFRGPGFFPPGTAGEGIDIDRNRWAFGIVFSPAPGVLIKLEYDMDKDRLADFDENGMILQAALRF